MFYQVASGVVGQELRGELLLIGNGRRRSLIKISRPLTASESLLPIIFQECLAFDLARERFESYLISGLCQVQLPRVVALYCAYQSALEAFESSSDPSFFNW